MTLLSKIDYCEKCPAYESGHGRCSAYGLPMTDVYVVGSAPKESIMHTNYQAFSDESGIVYRNILGSIKKLDPKFMALKVKMHHAAHCYSEDMNTDTIQHCSSLVKHDIFSSKPKVILALGAEAMKSLGIKGTVGEMRGQELYITIGDRDIPVVVSFAPGALIRKGDVGKLPTAKHDIQMALNIAAFGKRYHKTIDELTKDYIICKTPDEFSMLVDMVLRQPADLPDGSAGPAESNLLAIDTETAVTDNKYSSINTWIPGFKMIALSVSWAKGQSAAVLLDHKLNKYPYSAYEEDVKRLLSSPNPKTWHNFKYDFKVLEMAYGYAINNTMFDSQMGEFLLDENKKGEYGLKKIVKNRVPDFFGYEKALRTKSEEILEKIEAAKKLVESIAISKKDFKADAKLLRSQITLINADKKLLSKKTDSERLLIMDGHKAEKATTLNNFKVKIEELTQETKLLKAQIVTYKEVIDDLKDMSFEDMDVDVMLMYAAIDTDCTRQISKQQISEIKRDGPKLFYVLSKVMLPSARVLGEMEHVGIKVDLEYLEELRVHFEKVIEENAATVYQTIGREINLNSAKSLIDVLVVDFGVKLSKKTKSGQLSTDAAVMEELAKEYPIARLILEYKKAYKVRHTFLKGIIDGGKNKHDYGCSIDGRIHGNYNQTVAATGRLCVAKGSLVEVVRDVSKSPKGIPIEDVKVGDLVYSYDKDRKLVLRKVTWAGQTGHKKVVRIHWKRGGDQRLGYLDVTPDHRVRLICGKFIQAQCLKPHDRILSLSRSYYDGYSILFPFKVTRIRDHRFIFNEIHNYFPEHVHHIDENPLNNDPNNLMGMLHTEHARLHTTSNMALKSNREHLSKVLTTKYRDNPELWSNTKKFAEQNGNYKRVSKVGLLTQLAMAKGSPSLCPSLDYETVKNRLSVYQISWKSISDRYANTGVYLYKSLVVHTLSFCKSKTESARSLGITTLQLAKILKQYKLSPTLNNHSVKALEYLENTVDVYCLEVEDTHNFICNELCIANSSSSPNMQNLMGYALGMNIKKMFIPDSDDDVMVQVDYSAAEVRVLTAYASDPELIKVLNAGLDMHSFVGSNVFATKGIFNTPGVTYDELKNREQHIKTNPEEYTRLDTMRQISKMVMFLTIYGGGAYTLQGNLLKAGIVLTMVDCETIMAMLLKKFPAISTYMRTIKNTVNKCGEVQTYFGRKRRFPIARFSYKMKKAAYREAINAPIQGTSSDIVLHQMVELHGALNKLGNTRIFRGTVHDSVFFQFPKEQLHLLKSYLDVYIKDNVRKNFTWMPVDFEYDAEFGPSYGEAKTNLKTFDFEKEQVT